MQKELKNYRTNLVVIFVCFVITILINTHLFNFNSMPHLLYGIAMVLLGGLVFYCLMLNNKDISTSTKIATIIGPIMAIMSFIEGFMYGKGFIINFRISGLFIMIGGFLIFNSARKLKNSNPYY